jgi:DNA-binding transcriptional LysR family regulator
VRLGIQQDFGEHVLTEVLGRYARVHPRVRIEARAARNTELMELLNSGRLDMALAWEGGAATPHALDVGRLAMRWIGAADDARVAQTLALVGNAEEPLPLVMMDAPCVMRSAALRALDQAGIPWRIAFTSPGLSGVWAAVAAGLGVTVRTDVGLPPSLRVLEAPSLPPLPDIGLRLYRAEADLHPAAQHLHDIVLEALTS